MRSARRATGGAVWLAVLALAFGVPSLGVAQRGAEPAATGPVVAVYSDAAAGASPEAAQAIVAALEQRHVAARTVSADDLSDPAKFNRARFALLIDTGGPRIPAAAGTPLRDFLQEGGRLIVLGAPPFTEPVWEVGGRWLTHSQLLAAVAGGRQQRWFGGSLDKGWSESTDARSGAQLSRVSFSATARSAGDSAPGGRPETALHAVIPRLSKWDVWFHPVAHPVGARVSASDARFFLWARGGADTPQVGIELDERDGSRWMATVNVTTRWQPYTLSASDFTYWPDNSSKGRGGPGDSVHLDRVVRMSVGLSTYAPTPADGPGRHEFWVAGIGTIARPTAERAQFSFPATTGLYPAYKLYPVRGSVQVTADPLQVIVPKGAYPSPKALVSTSPRPRGTGFDKGRRYRFVPLLEAADPAGGRQNAAAWLVLEGGPDPGTLADGAWAVFGYTDPAAYTDPAVARAVADTARFMVEGLFLFEAGSERNAVFSGPSDVRLGAVVTRLDGGPFPDNTAIAMRVVDPGGKTVHAWTPRLARGARQGLSGSSNEVEQATWHAATLSAGRYTIVTSLSLGGRTIDRLVQPFSVWRPAPAGERRFVTVAGGAFRLGGKPWFADCINYMPSSGIGTDDNARWEHWLSASAYAPYAVEGDLTQIEHLGFDCISVFVYDRDVGSGNLLDLLMRAARHHLKVNLALRPAADPMHFSASQVTHMIERARLAENDTVFAYDLAWERDWGTYQPSYGNQVGRRGYDADWRRWIEDRYGSVSAAERDWGYQAPRDANGLVRGPTDAQLDHDGRWRKMVAAYRRFLDDLLEAKDLAATQVIRSLDPHHLISFRMGPHAGNPTSSPEQMGYDFRGLAYSMDIMEPEGYGRAGDWNAVRPGIFTAAYARYAAPGRPLMWAEFGESVWSGSNFRPSEADLRKRAAFYDRFYRMIAQSGANGAAPWFFPGGYRVDEKSDFGIVNPDGSPRPSAGVIQRWAPKLAGLGSPKRPDVWIEVHPGSDARGLYGVYEHVAGAFWEAVLAGKTVGLRDAGTGTTSADTPLVAVGGTPYDGANPPRYLDAVWDRVEVRDATGRWVDVRAGGRVKVAAHRPVYIRARVGNTEEARWLASPAGHAPLKGDVGLGSRPDSQLQAWIPIQADTPYLGTATTGKQELSDGIAHAVTLDLQMEARGRMRFGPVLRFTLEPVSSGG